MRWDGLKVVLYEVANGEQSALLHFISMLSSSHLINFLKYDRNLCLRSEFEVIVELTICGLGVCREHCKQ